MPEKTSIKKDRVSLGILGMSGRMGSAISSLAAGDSLFKLAGGCGSKGSAEEVFAQAEVVIDVSLAAALPLHLDLALRFKKPLVIGSTGHREEVYAAIREASKQIPIFTAANFSLAIACCLRAAELFAKQLDCSIEITETHHVHKKDAPSGTALALAHVCGTKSAIQSIREGDVVGKHAVFFKMAGETLELKHEALSRDAFAKGALAAAAFLSTQSPGLYTMNNLIDYGS